MAKKSQRLRRQRRAERMRMAEQEIKMSKAIEDNSAIIERMKTKTNTIDEYLKKIVTIKEEKEEEASSPVVDRDPSVEIKDESAAEMTIQPFNEPTLIVANPPPNSPNFKKMTKKNLLSYAKENEISIKSTMNKSQIIKTIEAA